MTATWLSVRSGPRTTTSRGSGSRRRRAESDPGTLVRMPDGPAPAASDRVVLITGATGVAGRGGAGPAPGPLVGLLVGRARGGGAGVVLIPGGPGVAGGAAAAAMAAGGAGLALSGTDASRLAAVAADLGLEPDRWLPVVA